MSGTAIEDQEKGSNISKRVNKLLESRLENDKETLLALKELSSFFSENNIQSRRNLRSKIEKRSLDINEDFLAAFRQVKESLDKIYDDVLGMNASVQNMSAQLNATKAETHQLLEQTAKLQQENQKLCMEEEIAEAFLSSFQLTKVELGSLREANVTEDFFSALERVQTIHANCRQLMQSGHQTSALDIMDQMAMYQEAALERLYRWAQAHCKSIESPAIGQLLTKAMSKLQDRPVLFKYVVGEYCTQRRGVLVRLFVDALTKGGPGGTPRPIETQAHDPERYVSDMLAFLHQAVPTEADNLMTLLKGADKMDITEEVQEALANITEGVCTPLRVRIEHVVNSETIPVKALYGVTNLLWFYHQTFLQEIGGGGGGGEGGGESRGLVVGLAEAAASAGEALVHALSSLTRRELEGGAFAPGDRLTPPPPLHTLLAVLSDLLSTSRPALSASGHDYTDKVAGCILDPLLRAIDVSASRLPTTDMAVYLLNCLHRMQTALALHQYMDERLERLQAQADAQLDTLTSEQASCLVANLNLGPIYTILQEGRGSRGQQPLSAVPGMQPSSLNNFLRKLESFISMPELLMLPQTGWLLSGGHRSLVQKRSIEVIVAVYRQLYTAVHETSSGYDDPDSLLPMTPERVASSLLPHPTTTS